MMKLVVCAVLTLCLLPGLMTVFTAISDLEKLVVEGQNDILEK